MAVRPHGLAPVAPPADAGSELDLASRELAAGAGPALGASLHCAASLPTGALCQIATGSPRPSVASEMWQNASFQNGINGVPRGAYGGAMAYDAYDRAVVYFGGTTRSTLLDETWLFSGGLWYNATAQLARAPPAAAWPAMDFDATYQVVLLYGGCSASACPGNSTWYYTASSGWTNITASLSPATPGLTSAALAYAADGAAAYSVLFGGCTDAGCLMPSNRTYGFAGSGWIEIPTPHSPPATWGAGLSYDPAFPGLILFGGCTVAGCTDGQTWTYYNFEWTDQTVSFAAPGAGPPGRSHSVLTWDELDSVLVLFGGGAGSRFFGDTWGLSCGSGSCLWRNLTPSGSSVPSLQGALAPSESNASIGTMLFGGLAASPAPSNSSTYLSNGTYFFEPPLSSVPAVPASAPARSDVAVSAHPSGGSGSYARYAGSYAATWTYAGTFSTGVNATLRFSDPGTYNVTLTLRDRFGVFRTTWASHSATGPFSEILGGPAVTVDAALSLQATPAEGGSAPYSYRWTFGDGGSDTGLSVSHTWTSAGDFPVTLFVVDAQGVIFTTTVTIRVLLPLGAAITASRTAVDAGATVTLSASVTGGAAPWTYAWSFDDGGRTTNVTSPAHPCFTVGHVVVTLDVTDSAGDHVRTSLTITVTPALGGSGSASPNSAQVGDRVHLLATSTGGASPFSFEWVFGDGTVGSGATVDHVFTAEGSYSPRVWINDSVGGTFNRTVVVTIDPASPVEGPGPAGSDLFSGPAPYLLLGAVVAIAAIAFVLLRLRRRRADPPMPPEPEDGEPFTPPTEP